MVETHWNSLRGEELRYRDHTWELTGDVEVRNSGTLLALDATRTDGVRGEDAVLYFGVGGSNGSLNPGNLGDDFHSLERIGENQYRLTVKSHRTYPYDLQRLEYH